MFRCTHTLARNAVLPVLLLLLAVATPLATMTQSTPPVAAQEQLMTTSTVMIPVGGEMMSVTVRMPTTLNPEVRRIPGGYEIDYGGPSVRVERMYEG